MALPKIKKTSIVQLVAEGEVEGQTTLNVFNYIPIPAGDADEMNSSPADCIECFRTMWRDEILPLCVTDFSIKRYFFREISGSQEYVRPDASLYKSLTVRQFYFEAGSTGDVGSVEGDPLPTFNAVAFYYSTLLNGRYSKGAKRFAGLYKAAVEATDGNLLTNAALTGWKAIEATLVQNRSTGILDEYLAPCQFFKTAMLRKPQPVTDTTLYRINWAVALAQRVITSQVSRKRRNQNWH